MGRSEVVLNLTKNTVQQKGFLDQSGIEFFDPNKIKQQNKTNNFKANTQQPIQNQTNNQSELDPSGIFIFCTKGSFAGFGG